MQAYLEEKTRRVLPQLRIKVDTIVEIVCVTLIALMFISKLSLKWTKVVPYSIFPFVYQYGLSPYINFALNFISFPILFFIWVKKRNKVKQNPLYIIYMYILMGTLTIQTFLQIGLVNVSQSASMQIGGLAIALVLLTMYGIIIPSLFPLERFVEVIRKNAVLWVLLSLVLLPIFYPYFFRGGRFIGVFKHIPHMVSASTFAFIFFIPKVYALRKDKQLKESILDIVILFLLAVAVLLTATKAAFVTILVVFLTATLLYGSKKKVTRVFKIFVISTLSLGILLFGVPTAEFVYDVATGQKSFGMRPAQDGVESRLDEVYRGIKMFQKEPVFGQGILYKFMGGDGVELDGYNSFKDPHNLFISAAVIGGWPFLVLSIIGYFMMIIGTIKGLAQRSIYRQVLGLFLLSHLPVFIIYHVHLSLGGMGDRMYYLIFGYLAQIWPKSDQST
ncbi:MAG: hypothetical protein Fur0010_05950 [Bdellovibrio sp.]